MSTINIYWGKPESDTNTRILSNLAPRPFSYQGHKYGSVEHAYQVLKAGGFDSVTHNKYLAVGGYGRKIRGQRVNRNFDNLNLMRILIRESFIANLNSDMTQMLLRYDNFTHTTNTLIDKVFLAALQSVRIEILKLRSRHE